VQGTSASAQFGSSHRGRVLGDAAQRHAPQHGTGDAGAAATGPARSRSVTRSSAGSRRPVERRRGFAITTTTTIRHRDRGVRSRPIAAARTTSTSNPDFVNSAGGDYHLAGAPADRQGEPGPSRLANRRRLLRAPAARSRHGGMPFVRDIGAAEFQTSPPTASASRPRRRLRAAARSTHDSCGPERSARYSTAGRSAMLERDVDVKHAFALPARTP